MPGNTAPAKYIAPKKLTFMICSASSTARRFTSSPGLMPALLTRMSTRPISVITCSANDRSDTSPTIATAPLPHRATTSLRRSARRATATTFAPRAASASAVTAPMPEEAPVTTATAPSMRTRSARRRADDADEAHTLTRRAPQVVGESERAPFVDCLDLAFGRCFPAQLQPALEEHSQARRADRMTERLQSAVWIDRQVAVEVERTVEHVLPPVTTVGEA